MNDDTIDREEALKAEINIISSDGCLHVIDHRTGKTIKTFLETKNVEAANFRKGYIAALMNEVSEGQGEARPLDALVMPAEIDLVSKDTFEWLADLGQKYKRELYDDIFNSTSYHITEIAECDGVDISDSFQMHAYKCEINKLLLLVLLQQV